ncbi:hypothetical protein PBI_WAITS_58 [Gordonia phage Waits]|uniref:Uncharacterized protein n=1 Tax=Gordonia phage Waits TaxID=2108120 RepID=A0A2P1JSH0_9CAUD|nr:hypothetical protein FDJ48_gp052 [Gordonia phage Waits]AVO22087.1 hypothetical protein PBI_WAITS_58 [Gordonia phage Waits]
MGWIRRGLTYSDGDVLEILDEGGFMRFRINDDRYVGILKDDLQELIEYLIEHQ